ncbi:hypothetical protein GALMADRAFT_217622 [Galerina marginata CBS 339.88]|uniref:Uncharacterized protein n=1 Tax=Galerina marginata (strain CBS 339.88) TaxID=685588 RepID=A0A067S396_GALM3|nr:hypothetical protein GALMADRAFT_217622 [Galerina marginata CBS 339.88]
MEGHVNFDLPVLVSETILTAITSFWLALWPYAVDLVDRYGVLPDRDTVLELLTREYHNLALLYETYADPDVPEPANIRRMRNWLHWLVLRLNLDDAPYFQALLPPIGSERLHGLADLYPLDVDFFDINLGGDVQPNAFDMDGEPNLGDMSLAGPTLRSSRAKGKGRQRSVSSQPRASTSQLPPSDEDYEDDAEEEPKPKTRRNTRTTTPANAKPLFKAELFKDYTLKILTADLEDFHDLQTWKILTEDSDDFADFKLRVLRWSTLFNLKSQKSSKAAVRIFRVCKSEKSSKSAVGISTLRKSLKSAIPSI